MAEYGIQATELSAPQGAGTQVVQPVQPASIAPVLGFVSDVGSIFAKDYKQSKKDEAEKLKQSVVDKFVQEKVSINNALSSGQMSTSEAATRYKLINNKYFAGYSQYIPDFKAASDAMVGMTEEGTVVQEQKDIAQFRQGELKKASDLGIAIYPGMSKDAENSAVALANTTIRSKAELDDVVKRNTETRTQTEFERKQLDADTKRKSISLLTDTAGANIDTFSQFSKDLGQQVRAGKITQQQAQGVLAQQMARIEGGLQAIAGQNPELAAPYRSIFDNLNKIGMQMTDPANDVKSLEDQMKLLLTQSKLAAIADPSFRGVVAINQLLPNSPEALLIAKTSVNEAIARASNVPVNSPDYVPQIAGNQDIEGSVLKSLKESLTSLAGGQIKEKEIATIQASNSANHILKQTGDLLNRGVTPSQLTGLASFFASPQYATLISSGKLDKQAAGAAGKTFQILYEKDIMKTANTKFDQFLYQQAAFGQKQAEPKTIAEIVVPRFDGSSISFDAKALSLDPVEAASQKKELEALKPISTAINQLIRLGAHLEGTQDYEAYWEKKKYDWLPQVYPLRPGDAVGNMRFKGGDYTDKRNYEPIGKTDEKKAN